MKVSSNLTQKNNNARVFKNIFLTGVFSVLMLTACTKDKNTVGSKVSASVLNGYAAVADKLADSKNIELESNIGNQGRVASTIWRVFIYFVLLSALLAYIYAILRKRK